ncbi:unnamed protein product [Gongylonema pulchrum]|uniref:Uncharacterized protein n=1 Tax=Gongylonema pulchrum TaxID=637853 RepID=A0A183E6J8_9BILA|nr:unnamed protein product [Gongylonema pulchrum]
MDKLLITNNYDFFVSSMSSIIRYLQKRADNVFGSEQSDTSNEAMKQATASRASMHMTWLLRTQTRLCTEYLLEGVPTQDMLVMKEREKDWADGDGDSVDINASRNIESIATLRQIAKMLERLPRVDNRSVLDVVLTQLVIGGQVSAQIIIKCWPLSDLMANLLGCPLETPLSPDAIDIVVLTLHVPPGGIRSPAIDEDDHLRASSLSSGGCISPPMSTSSKEDNMVSG